MTPTWLTTNNFTYSFPIVVYLFAQEIWGDFLMWGELLPGKNVAR